MGKNRDKRKDDIPNPSSVANRDILQRLNFLYQASVFLNGLAPPGSISDEDDPPRSSTAHSASETGTKGGESSSHPKQSRRKKGKGRRVVSFEELSRSYVETMKSVGQKTNVRMDPSVKRRICKRCSAPLVPGISATVRIRDSVSHGHLVSYRCRCCRTERRIPAPPVLRVDPPTNEGAMDAQSAEASTSSMVATTTPTGDSVRPGQQRRKKGGPRPRFPPHFARDVGHIVFRGNERLDKAHSIS